MPTSAEHQAGIRGWQVPWQVEQEQRHYLNGQDLLPAVTARGSCCVLEQRALSPAEAKLWAP